MINHFRTLLLNKHNSEAGLTTGLPYVEYIDGNFSPVIQTNQLNTFRTTFITDSAIELQLLRVTNLMKFLHTQDLLYYTLYFDNRITYKTDNYDLTVAQRDDFDINTIYPTMELTWLSAPIRTYLLDIPSTWPRNELNEIITKTTDITVKMGAMLLTYCFKCESVRMNNTGT